MGQSAFIQHYSPDTAPLAIRLALEKLGVTCHRQLVDHREKEHRGTEFRALHRKGLIPVAQAADGPLLEAAAILLWLSVRHPGSGPAFDSPARANMPKWLFFMSNTLHPTFQRLCYPPGYSSDYKNYQAQLDQHAKADFSRPLTVFDTRFADPRPGLLLVLYPGPMLRWLARCPLGSDARWFDVNPFSGLFDTATALKNRATARKAARAEGIGSTPFTCPHLATPPEGNPT